MHAMHKIWIYQKYVEYILLVFFWLEKKVKQKISRKKKKADAMCMISGHIEIHVKVSYWPLLARKKKS